MATTVINGRKTVTTAGTAEQLSTSATRVSSVAIQALETNTGKVCVGSSNVIASQSTRNAVYLEAGVPVVLDVDQLTDIYLDVTVNGEGVTYTGTKGT